MEELLTGGSLALLLGFLLGLKHATDADHVVAVSTIVSEYKNPWRSLWVGVSWGLGHTTPLLILGVVILLLRETVLDHYQAVAPVLEFGVGVMLVFLGVQVLWNLRRSHLHLHTHEHDGGEHIHAHAHALAAEELSRRQRHHWLAPAGAGRPFFRLKSYVIGVVHGLAGSAAAMLLLLPQIDGIALGVGYLLLFGVGTVISMGGITILLSVPFAITGRVDRLNRLVAGVAGVASLVFGTALILEIAFDAGFLSF